MDFLGSLFSAGANLFGGLLGQKNSKSIAEENIANQNYLANNRISMTVEDAKRAGINPLAALGNATQSYSNVVGDNSLGDSVGKGGQEIGRAIAAMTPSKVRNAELENKLLEAKIANMNADTVKEAAVASQVHKTLGVPGIPYPTPDPRGPVINLMQRARDPRTGEIVWIPSDKAASPLQTLAASPTNAALAGRSLSEGLLGLDSGGGQAERSASSKQWDFTIPSIPQWPQF